jgi:hypothetical protein
MRDTQNGTPSIVHCKSQEAQKIEEKRPQKIIPQANRFTAYLWFTFAASNLLLAACIISIVFLWFAQNNSSWHSLILKNRFTTAVTLTALALRIAVGIQAGIATSMLAALIIVSLTCGGPKSTVGA